jgi:hypothetical protein
MTTLSVVNNQGWMLPYIACMIAMFGMFAQFGQTLIRFLDRTVTGSGPVTVPAGATLYELRPGFGPARSVAAPAAFPAAKLVEEPTSFMLKYGIPILVTLIFAAWLGRKAMHQKPSMVPWISTASLSCLWRGADGHSQSIRWLASSCWQRHTSQLSKARWMLRNSAVMNAARKSCRRLRKAGKR